MNKLDLLYFEMIACMFSCFFNSLVLHEVLALLVMSSSILSKKIADIGVCAG